MLSLGAQLQERDLGKAPLSAAELGALIGDADIANFLNTRSPAYHQRKLRARPPTKAEAIELMAQDPNLIRRPIIVKGRTQVIGFDEARLRAVARS